MNSRGGLLTAQLVKTITLGATLLGLVACGQLPLTPSGAASEQAWQARQGLLSTLQAWRLQGRIAIQAETPQGAKQEGWHAALRWEQQADNYQITLSSPLGQDLAQLHGSAQGVILHTAQGEDSAQDSEALLYKRLGVRLPLAGLRYWVLGLPNPSAPVAPHERVLDGLGRLTQLRQQGWEIEFRRYTAAPGLDLPDKLFLSTQADDTPIEVRLVVEEWSLTR